MYLKVSLNRISLHYSLTRFRLFKLTGEVNRLAQKPAEASFDKSFSFDFKMAIFPRVKYIGGSQIRVSD